MASFSLKSSIRRSGYRGPARHREIEYRILEQIALATGEREVRLANAVTCLGETSLVWSAVAATSVAAGIRARHPAAVCRPVVALLLISLSRYVLARSVDRARPPEHLRRARYSGPSFPSRHTTLAGTGAVLVASSLCPDRTRSSAAIVVVVGAAVGLSRLVLGVHWPTDVIAGWAISTGAAVVLWPKTAPENTDSPPQSHGSVMPEQFL
ncbi:phosphatase PAP2 family protein [Sciscionella marina]|uniref:phosphatase PAP2 family protein n=1 Tax=Sciscionella marina TaxID=508770 RepID=UPI00037A4F0E|nr:phosphatase PAP2 family protein [Sciscionella marina]